MSIFNLSDVVVLLASELCIGICSCVIEVNQFLFNYVSRGIRCSVIKMIRLWFSYQTKSEVYTVL